MGLRVTVELGRSVAVIDLPGETGDTMAAEIDGHFGPSVRLEGDTRVLSLTRHIRTCLQRDHQTAIAALGDVDAQAEQDAVTVAEETLRQARRTKQLAKVASTEARRKALTEPIESPSST